MHHPIDMIACTTAFGTPVMEHWMEKEITNRSTVKDWSDNPLHYEQTLLPLSYILLQKFKSKAHISAI